MTPERQVNKEVLSIKAKYRLTSSCVTGSAKQVCSALSKRSEQEVLLSGTRAMAESSLNLQVISQGNMKLQNKVGGQ